MDILLSERPQDQAPIKAWKAGVAFTRAVHAFEAGHTDAFEREYRKARALYAEAATIAPSHPGVLAITVGGYAVLADRLPEQYRFDGWNTAYTAFKGLWQLQSSELDKLPLHMKGELLAGIAQSALRSGRKDEAAQFLGRIVTLMPGTPYAVSLSMEMRPLRCS